MAAPGSGPTRKWEGDVFREVSIAIAAPLKAPIEQEHRLQCTATKSFAASPPTPQGVVLRVY